MNIVKGLIVNQLTFFYSSISAVFQQFLQSLLKDLSSNSSGTDCRLGRMTGANGPLFSLHVLESHTEPFSDHKKAFMLWKKSVFKSR